MFFFSLIKNGAKLTEAGFYEGTSTKTEGVTLANKVQLENPNFVFAFVDKVTGSKFNENVTLLTAPLSKNTIDLGKGEDSLTISHGTYVLSIKNVETVKGTGGHEVLQLSGVANFDTDGSIDTLRGDSSSQTITYAAIEGNSTIDLQKGRDVIVLADSIGEYTTRVENGALIVRQGDDTLTITNQSGNKSLTVVMGGQSYTWDQAIGYAADDSADADGNFSVAVAAGDRVTNNAEKTSVQVNLSGIDSDAARVVVLFTYQSNGPIDPIQVEAVRQPNGSWVIPPVDLSGIPDGQVNVYGVVIDQKGNVSWAGGTPPSPADQLLLDTTADAGEDLAIALASGLDHVSKAVKDASGVTPVTFAISGVDELATAFVEISDGVSVVRARYNTDTHLFEANLTSLRGSELFYRVVVTDEAGNSAAVEHVLNVVVDSFEGTVAQLQQVDADEFDGYVSVVVRDSGIALNGADLSTGNWSRVTRIDATDSVAVTFSAAELAGKTGLSLGSGSFTIVGTGAQVAVLPNSVVASLESGDRIQITGTVDAETLDALAGILAGDFNVDYAVADSAAALLDFSATGAAALEGAASITVVGAATVAQIDGLADYGVSYATVRDTVVALVSNGAAAAAINGNVDVEVVDGNGETGALSLAAYQTIDAANGSGAIDFTLADSKAGLFGSGDTLVNGAAAAIGAAAGIVVVDALNVAQSREIVAVADAPLVFDLRESAANLFSGPISLTAGAADVIAAARGVTVTGGLNFSKALIVNGANGNSYDGLHFTLTDDELNLFNGDGVAQLRTDVADMMLHAASIEIGGNGLTVAQAALVYAAHGGSFNGVSLTIKDSAANILAGAGTLFSGSDNVTVSVAPADVTGLSITQYGDLLSRIDNDAEVTFGVNLSVSDVFANGATFNAGYAAFIAAATSVAINGVLTPEQATAIYDLKHSAVYDVAGTLADLRGNLDATNGARDVTVTDVLSAVNAALAEQFTNDRDTTYDVQDSIANLLDPLNADAMNGARDISVSFAPVTAAQAKALAAFGNSGDTTYDVSDSAAHLLDPLNAAGVNGADDITVSGMATVQQAASILAFDNGGSKTYNIEDNKAGIFVGNTAEFDSAAAIAGAHTVTVTDYITVAQAAQLKQAMAASGGAITAIAYNIVDTKEAIIAASDAGLFTTGGGITVGDVDVTDANLGSMTVADLAKLEARIGNDQPLSYTYAFTASDLFHPNSTWKDGAVAKIQAATAVTITDKLTAAQAQMVYTANQDGAPGTLTMDVADSWGSILLPANLQGVNAARDILVKDETPAPMLASVEMLSNTGATKYEAVAGTVAELANALGGANAGLQASVADIHVNARASASQVSALEAYANTGEVLYAQLGDTASSIVALLGQGDTAALQARIDAIEATGTGVNATTASEFAAIQSYAVGAKFFFEVAGTVAELDAVLGDQPLYQNDVDDIAVTGTASVGEVGALEAYDIGGVVRYEEVDGNADDIIALLNSDTGLQGRIADLVLSGTGVDATEVAELTTIEGYANTGEQYYAEVSGGGAALIAALDAGGLALQGRVDNITVTDWIGTADLATIEAYGNSGVQYYAEVRDTAVAVIASVVGTGLDAERIQEQIGTLNVTGNTALADARALDGYDVAEVHFAKIYLDFADVTNSAYQSLFTKADGLYLNDYDLGEVTVAQVDALLASGKLKDATGNPIAVDDLIFTLSDTAEHLAAGGRTASIVGRAADVEVDNADSSHDASVNQAKVIYDRNNLAKFDIKDSAAALASTATVTSGAAYATVILAAKELVATGVANAVQAQRIFDRDGTAGDTVYAVSDSYSNLTNGAYASGVAYAGSITAYVNHSWNNGANSGTSLYNLAATADANGTAKLFMGELYYDTIAEWKAFDVTGAHQVLAGTLEYTYKVYDSAANVATAAANADLAIMTGAGEVRVSDNMSVAQAETMWSAMVAPFGGEAGAAAKTYYTISDTVANLTNAKMARVASGDHGDDGAVANADGIYVNDSAANIYAAQLAGDEVFARLDELPASGALTSGGITASGSALQQRLNGSRFSDSLNGGDDDDTLYGNGGDDTLVGGNGNDRIYGGDGHDTLYAGTAAGAGTGTAYRGVSDLLYGGAGSDDMYGSGTAGNYDRDLFVYAGENRDSLIAESSTQVNGRDYIYNFGLGDAISFENVTSVQYLGTGSANATAVAAGTLAISIRYVKDTSVVTYNEGSQVTATKVLIDIANSEGKFDDVADMEIIIVGNNLDLHWTGSGLVYGG